MHTNLDRSRTTFGDLFWYECWVTFGMRKMSVALDLGWHGICFAPRVSWKTIYLHQCLSEKSLNNSILDWGYPPWISLAFGIFISAINGTYVGAMLRLLEFTCKEIYLFAFSLRIYYSPVGDNNFFCLFSLLVPIILHAVKCIIKGTCVREELLKYHYSNISLQSRSLLLSRNILAVVLNLNHVLWRTKNKF